LRVVLPIFFVEQLNQQHAISVYRMHRTDNVLHSGVVRDSA
jgi:hypothetical protein